jgi:hypothetical protein
VLRFLDGGVRGPGLVWRLGPLLGLQVLFSTELGLTMTVVLLAALAVAYVLVPGRRPRLRSLALPLLWAYLFGGLLIAPFLYYLLSIHIPPPFYSGLSNFDADLANLVVPTKLTSAGGTFLGGVSSRFLANLPEQGFYLGLPTIVIVALYLGRRRRAPAARFLIAALALSILAALGSRVTVAGHAILPLPYTYLTSYPVFDNLLTDRFVVYTWLAAAVTVALWTAARRPGALRIVLPVLAAVSIAPNLAHSGLATSYEIPPFFTESVYASCIDPGETVLPFPSRGDGHALLWQVASGFRFNLTTGDIGPNKPRAMFPRVGYDPVPGGLPLGVGDAGTLRAFLPGRGVTSIVVDGSVANSYVGAVDQIAPPHVVGGVYLYHLTGFAPSCVGG